MPKVKLDIRKKNIPQQVQFIRQVVSRMTGNPNFTSPSPSLAELTDLADKLESDYQKREEADSRARQLAVTLAATEEETLRVMGAVAGYIESVTHGDEALIRSAGVDVRSTNTTSAEMTAPHGLSLAPGSRDGTLTATWTRVAGSKSYVAQMSLDPAAVVGWVLAGVSTRTQFTLTGLDSGKRYWVRVAAVSPTGQGPWSDPAVKVAP